MTNESFINKLRSFLGLQAQPPRNEFRNPIWGSDDDDDGDELYSRQHMDVNSELDLHQELTRHMHEMFTSFGGIFGDMKTFFNDDFKGFFHDEMKSIFDHDNYEHEYAGSVPFHSTDPEKSNSSSLRDYYLKPGYHSRKPCEKQDIDLDGKISSQEISGLLKKQEEQNSNNPNPVVPFDPSKIPGRSFCRTIITTSVTKPDGTIETRKIVKNGNEVIEETITSTDPELRGPHSISAPGLNTVSTAGILLSELASLFRNFY